MGLDMYLTGEKYYWQDYKEPRNNIKEDGFRLKTKTFEVGYWRKHPDLHGFIVQTFADNIDECQDIYLNIDNLKQIINAIKEKQLPKTHGCFYGESNGSEDDESIRIFINAIDWLECRETKISKSITYRAS